MSIHILEKPGYILVANDLNQDKSSSSSVCIPTSSFGLPDRDLAFRMAELIKKEWEEYEAQQQDAVSEMAIYKKVKALFGAQNGFPSFTEDRVLAAIRVCFEEQKAANAKEAANEGTPDASIKEAEEAKKILLIREWDDKREVAALSWVSGFGHLTNTERSVAIMAFRTGAGWANANPAQAGVKLPVKLEDNHELKQAVVSQSTEYAEEGDPSQTCI